MDRLDQLVQLGGQEADDLPTQEDFAAQLEQQFFSGKAPPAKRQKKGKTTTSKVADSDDDLE